MLAKGFLEQRRQLDDPPVHGRVIGLNTVFRNHLFEITQTQRIGHVPAHTPQDHVQREVQPFHNFGDARRQRLSRNPFLLHRGFWQIFHPKILPHLVIATEPLASAAGDEALLPVEPKKRANVERWMDWQLATLWATLRVAFLGLTRTPEPQRDYDAIRKAHADAGRMLAIVDKVLSAQAYVAGAKFTVADIVICLSAHRWFS